MNRARRPFLVVMTWMGVAGVLGLAVWFAVAGQDEDVSELQSRAPSPGLAPVHRADASTERDNPPRVTKLTACRVRIRSAAPRARTVAGRLVSLADKKGLTLGSVLVEKEGAPAVFELAVDAGSLLVFETPGFLPQSIEVPPADDQDMTDLGQVILEPEPNLIISFDAPLPIAEARLEVHRPWEQFKPAPSFFGRQPLRQGERGPWSFAVPSETECRITLTPLADPRSETLNWDWKVSPLEPDEIRSIELNLERGASRIALKGIPSPLQAGQTLAINAVDGTQPFFHHMRTDATVRSNREGWARVEPSPGLNTVHLVVSGGRSVPCRTTRGALQFPLEEGMTTEIRPTEPLVRIRVLHQDADGRRHPYRRAAVGFSHMPTTLVECQDGWLLARKEDFDHATSLIVRAGSTGKVSEVDRTSIEELGDDAYAVTLGLAVDVFITPDTSKLRETLPAESIRVALVPSSSAVVGGDRRRNAFTSFDVESGAWRFPAVTPGSYDVRAWVDRLPDSVESELLARWGASPRFVMKSLGSITVGARPAEQHIAVALPSFVPRILHVVNWMERPNGLGLRDLFIDGNPCFLDESGEMQSKITRAWDPIQQVSISRFEGPLIPSRYWHVAKRSDGSLELRIDWDAWPMMNIRLREPLDDVRIVPIPTPVTTTSYQSAAAGGLRFRQNGDILFLPLAAYVRPLWAVLLAFDVDGRHHVVFLDPQSPAGPIDLSSRGRLRDVVIPSNWRDGAVDVLARFRRGKKTILVPLGTLAAGDSRLWLDDRADAVLGRQEGKLTVLPFRD
ncbi:MAG TPA: hypothetical protein ENK43_05900 [Planctomycetes bacterium]|nr:hypothetical protein [Planctomycetota bacterium]